jgi:hypothetical protein
MAESECCTNPVYAAVIRTASKQLQLHDLNSETCQVNTLLMVSRFGQVELAACARLYPCCTNPVPAAIAPASRQQQRRLNSFSRTSCRHSLVHLFVCVGSVRSCACCILHLAVWACTQACAAQQQPTTADKSLQLHSLSSVMCPCKLVYICLLVPVVWSSRTQLVPV